ncbi:MAG: HIT family protein [Solirubrobacterales bacterium]
MDAEPDCLFCRIVAGDLPARIVAEDELTVSFMDISPATHGHALVVPRRHSEDLYSIGREDLEACMNSAQELALRARDRLGADGVNLLNSCRPDAWQTVFHFHVHVIPRYQDDPLKLPWVPRAGDEGDIEAAAVAYREG